MENVIRNDILNKKQFYDLYFQDRLGNHLHNWRTLEELRNSGHKKDIGIRSINDKNKFCFYYVPIDKIEKVIDDNKLNIEDCIFCEHAPDKTNLILQGELTKDIHALHYGMFLAYSRELKPMREAMPGFKTIKGLVCKVLLESILLPNSYNDLMLLLDMYPEHIIELGIYDVCLGIFKNQNMLIWEVRKY